MSSKTKFQVERIALFSDAVFAIAITLMIIEVKPPHLHHGISLQDATMALLKLTPMFIGVILSFMFIGVFWLRHHQLMKHMENYTPKLLRLNGYFLLTIVFLPFSTAFVFENFMAASPIPMVFYNLNYIIAVICNYRLFSYVLNPANGIMSPDDPERIENHRFELLYPIAVYTLVLCMSFYSVPIASMCYGAFSLEGWFIRKKKKSVATEPADALQP